MKSSFMFIRMLLEMLGFGKYVPKQGLYTAEEFIAEVDKALAWEPNKDLQGLLRAERIRSFAEPSKIVISVGCEVAEQNVDGSAVWAFSGFKVGPGGVYETSPTAGMVRYASHLVLWKDERAPDKVEVLKRLYAKAFMAFCDLYPFTREVNIQVRKTLAHLLDEEQAVTEKAAA